MKDILNSTPKSVEQVTIEPNGEWSQNTAVSPSAGGPTGNNTMIKADEIDDDDLLELHTSVVKSNLNSNSKTSTPSASNRLIGSPSVSGSVSRSTSNKRPVGSVIDLTLSDDEDENPRPAKRQATMDNPNALSAGGGGEGLMTSMMLAGANGSGVTNGNVNGSSGSKSVMNLALPFPTTPTST